MKQILKIIGMVIVIVAVLLFLSLFVFDFFLTMYNATRWECKKYETVQTVWFDYDQKPPTAKGQKQTICVVWERGK